MTWNVRRSENLCLSGSTWWCENNGGTRSKTHRNPRALREHYKRRTVHDRSSCGRDRGDRSSDLAIDAIFNLNACTSHRRKRETSVYVARGFTSSDRPVRCMSPTRSASIKLILRAGPTKYDLILKEGTPGRRGNVDLWLER